MPIVDLSLPNGEIVKPDQAGTGPNPIVDD